MKLTIKHGNVIDKLKEMPDNSIDIIVTSPPYFGARNYSVVKTITAESEEECIRNANEYMDNLKKENNSNNYYLSEIKHYMHNDGNSPDKWSVDIDIDISAIFGGDSECIHDFKELKTKLVHDNTNGQYSNTMQSIKSNSVNRPITSYVCTKCGAWKGNLGNESTVEEYISHMLIVTHELMRVLKPSGYMIFNIGDTYGGAMGKNAGYPDMIAFKHGNLSFPKMVRPGKHKSLLLVPERMLIGLSDQGWIIRNDIIWHKPNHKPESVLDRYAATFEHVFFVTKNPRYYFNLDAVRIPYSNTSLNKMAQEAILKQSKITNKTNKEHNPDINIITDKHLILDHSNPSNNHSYGGLSKWGNMGIDTMEENIIKQAYNTKYKDGEAGQKLSNHIYKLRSRALQMAPVLFPDNIKAQKEYIIYIHHHGINPLGKNPGDVWDINTSAYKGEHTAVFPPELAIRSLLAGPKKVCKECGSPEKLVSIFDEKVIWEGCKCNAGFTEATVLDPFAGAGTTLLAARNLGINAIGIEINSLYIEQIKERLNWNNSLDIEYYEEA